jgi:hypothetical protein
VRPTKSISIVGAAAHARLPAPKTLRPNKYDHRGPSRITVACTVVAVTTEETRYTVVTQA